MVAPAPPPPTSCTLPPPPRRHRRDDRHWEGSQSVAVLLSSTSSPAPPSPPARRLPPRASVEAGVFSQSSSSMFLPRTSIGQSEGKGWDWAGIGFLGGVNRTTEIFLGGIYPGPGVPRGLGRIPGRERLNRTRPKLDRDAQIFADPPTPRNQLFSNLDRK
jgi:hypothetical protein